MSPPSWAGWCEVRRGKGFAVLELSFRQKKRPKSTFSPSNQQSQTLPRHRWVRFRCELVRFCVDFRPKSANNVGALIAFIIVYLFLLLLRMMEASRRTAAGEASTLDDTRRNKGNDASSKGETGQGRTAGGRNR